MIDRNYRILITRSKDRSASLIKACEVQGIQAYAIPLTEQKLTESANSTPELSKYKWVIFTSVIAVNITAGALKLDLTKFADEVKFAVVGKATGVAVTNSFKLPDIIAEPSSSNGLARTIIQKVLPDECGDILWICAENPVTDLQNILTSKGFNIDSWQVYRTLNRNSTLVSRELEITKPWDAIFFAAPSSVNAYSLLAEDIDEINCIAIGETTAEALANKKCKRITVCASTETADIVSAFFKSIGQTVSSE